MKSVDIIRRGVSYGKSYGAGRLARKALEHGMRLQAEAGYEGWLSAHLASEEELRRQREETAGEALTFSVLVPVYRTPEKFLREMIESVLNQSYENLELCIADGSDGDGAAGRVIREYMERDSRVKYRELEENGGISENTNAALAMAEGDFVCLLDHDDLLSPAALYELWRLFAAYPGMDAAYTDEDKVDFEGKKHFQPHFKPDFNRELLRSNNYVCHLFCVRRELAWEAGGFCTEYDGAQDYDFILKCTERARAVGHVPKILYHWRCHRASTAANPASKQYAYEAGRRAILAHLKRCGVRASVAPTDNPGFYRVRYKLTEAPPVIMMIQGNFTLSEAEWIKSRLLAVTDYPALDVYAGPDTEDGIWERLWTGRPVPEDAMLLFLNKDCFPLNRGWLRELVSCAVQPQTGCVTGRIYDERHRLAYGCEVLGMYGLAAANPFRGYRSGFYGYMHKIGLRQEVSAVAGECLLVPLSVLRELSVKENGFFRRPGWNIELCLRARHLGMRNIYTPYAVLELKGQRAAVPRLTDYAAACGREAWAGELCLPDPFYNDNLSRERGGWVRKSAGEANENKGQRDKECWRRQL